MAGALGEGKGRLSAQQDAMLEQMISEKLTAISNRCTTQKIIITIIVCGSMLCICSWHFDCYIRPLKSRSPPNHNIIYYRPIRCDFISAMWVDKLIIDLHNFLVCRIFAPYLSVIKSWQSKLLQKYLPWYWLIVSLLPQMTSILLKIGSQKRSPNTTATPTLSCELITN